jgi:hypothetical protein
MAKQAAHEFLSEHPHFGNGFHDFADTLAEGTAWPDCPVMLEDGRDRLNVEMESSYNSCRWIPGAGVVGFHEGFTEMAGQTLKQNIPLLGSMRTKERMGNNRMLMQHQHASPLPTVHLVREDATCDEECRQVLHQKCTNSMTDRRVHFCDLPPFAQTWMGTDFLYAGIHPIPHGLSTNRQVRNKILEQSGKWFCKAIQHSTTALLLKRDYRWERERSERVERLQQNLYWGQYWGNGSMPQEEQPSDPWGSWMKQSVHLLSSPRSWDDDKQEYEYESSSLSDDEEDMRTFSQSERRLGVHYLGRILHILQDSFSESHTQRIQRLGEIPHISQFYSMDDVDWKKHASLDKRDNGMLQTATAASLSVLREFGRFVDALETRFWNATHSSTQIVDNMGGATLFDNGLRRFLQVMCTNLELDPADLVAPAGGSSDTVSLTGRNWRPQAMPENLAEEYRRQREVYDYPPPDKDICTSVEVLSSHLPDHYAASTYHRASRTPAHILGGDGLGVGRDTDISLTCRGLGASSTITLQDVGNKESVHPGDYGIVKLTKTNLAWWKLYSE